MLKQILAKLPRKSSKANKNCSDGSNATADLSNNGSFTNTSQRVIPIQPEPKHLTHLTLIPFPPLPISIPLPPPLQQVYPQTRCYRVRIGDLGFQFGFLPSNEEDNGANMPFPMKKTRELRGTEAELEELEGAELEEQLLQPATTAPAAPDFMGRSHEGMVTLEKSVQGRALNMFKT
ncbi:hypothetical protein M8C21_005883 [Ambrosia artemisiifolia]|uniref:Uncharacterized protein n=1 Tax=Ambrosia artemisiifolia TaxID=4212 RepID=A0AAD5CAQ1_AMBAR|nr:hypothetical protein M8C21_005883 [Ambrosia artemisiifolia]